MSARVLVTTSWDDGHRLDLRLADMLRAHGIPGTFYISPRNRELAAADLLSDAEVAGLAEDFEIGSHSMTHPVLTTVSTREVAWELAASKEYLEEVTGAPVTSFCYPRGAHDDATASAVEDAGYTYARTVRRFELGPTRDPFRDGTALEAHRGPLPTLHRDLVRIARLSGYRPVRTFALLDWERLARHMFDRAMDTGGVFHLWGHSWVLEQWQDWERLDRVLAYIAGRPSAHYVSNAQLRQEWTT